MLIRVYVTVGRLSVRLYVRLSVCLSVCLYVRPTVRPPRTAAAGLGLLLWASRAGGVDRVLHSRRSAANASSATLSADVGS